MVFCLEQKILSQIIDIQKIFVDLWSIDELILIDISEKKFSKNFLELIIFF